MVVPWIDGFDPRFTCAQISFFTLFTFLTLHVHLSPSFSLRQDASLRPVFRVLYATIVLLYVRNIFRIIEFAQGFYGYLATHEVFLYTFDFLEIFLCMVLFTAFHFGFYMGPTARARAEGGNVGDVECAIRTPVQPITNA